MNNLAVRLWMSFLLALVALYGSFTLWRNYQRHAAMTTARNEKPRETKGALLAHLPPVPLEEFSFIDSGGEAFPMQRLAGKVWVASYFFATCPGFCLQMNQEVARLARDLAGEEVIFVSFTVDPRNDTPEVLKEYAQRMRADPHRWIFLTGSETDIQKLGQEFLKVPATKIHNDKLLLVDRAARLRGQFGSRDAADIKRLKQAIGESIAASPATEEKLLAPLGSAEEAPE